MVKVFYRVLFTASLILFFVSPSFSMDAPDDIIKLGLCLKTDPVKHHVKTPMELYALGRYYYTHKNTDYPIEVVKEYYGKLVVLENDPLHFAQYFPEVSNARYTYALLHFQTLNPKSSAYEENIAEQLMRKAAHIGSTKAQQFLETMGYN